MDHNQFREVPAKYHEGSKAFDAALPELLKIYPDGDHWVAFHGSEQVGISKSKKELVEAHRIASAQHELVVRIIEEPFELCMHGFYEFFKE